MAAAFFGSVVVLAGAALVAWRWWLQHLATAVVRDSGEQSAEVKRLGEQLELMRAAVTKLEIRTAGR